MIDWLLDVQQQISLTYCLWQSGFLSVPMQDIANCMSARLMERLGYDSSD